jgi:hypothetical protein
MVEGVRAPLGLGLLSRGLMLLALAGACAGEDGGPADEETSFAADPGPSAFASDERADDPPASAEHGAPFAGDPAANELQILDLSHAELDDDFLLGLPGSEGMGLGGGAAGGEGGRSSGTPQAGRLVDGTPLPYAPALYTRRNPARSFGSSHTIETVQAALGAMRHDKHVHAEVIIGDLSQPKGGWFPPHVSHQSGRDIDIRLIVAPGLDRTTLPTTPEQVDWDAMWALVHSFLETGQVTYVFLGWSRQPHLYAAARRAGVHRRVLEQWFQWPDRNNPAAVIRHEDGHLAHIHVRLACSPADADCRGG